MQEILIPVILFSLVMAITPGPNNMISTASGTQYGYRRTVPFILGVVLGVVSMIALSGMGLGVLFERYPIIKTILKFVGSAYLIYLAIRILISDMSKGESEKKRKPLSIFQGALFQYINPKAYIMAISAVSVYSISGDLYIPSLLYIMGAFLIVGFFSVSVWALFGTVLGRYLNKGKSSRWINYCLSGLTAASVIFILI